MVAVIGILLLAMTSTAHAVSVQQIWSSGETDGGIFALESFNDSLYIGMFGYNRVPPYQSGSDRMLWRYNGSNVTPLDLDKDDLVNSESVCAMKAWNGHLYVGTERAGKMFKVDANNDVSTINNQGTRNVCSFATGDGKLLAINTHYGEYLWTENGRDWNKGTVPVTGDTDPYFRESVYFKGMWYAYGIKRTNNQRIAYRSKNLINWSAVTPPGRIFRTNVIDRTLWLGIAAAPAYGSQDHIAIHTTKDGINYTERYEGTGYSHLNKVYPVTINGQDKFIATVSGGFKPLDSSFGSGDSSALLQFNSDGSYDKKIHTFDGQEYAEATAFHNGEFYVGTMRGGYENQNAGDGRGWLYKVSGIEEREPVNIVPILQLLLLD